MKSFLNIREVAFELERHASSMMITEASVTNIARPSETQMKEGSAACAPRTATVPAMIAENI
jgi:hypothetical protein